MLIVADNNIPFAAEAFGHLGEVRTVRGRGLTAPQVAGADVLLLRSTVRIDAELLSQCSPKFVGTATIGTDHVDRDYLASRGIPFASAPGSNADSVAEYWSSAVLLVAARLGWNLRGVTCGVVGVGNIGSRVARRAEALGMRVLRCDPPLARETGDSGYRPLEELLAESRIITLHAPLNRQGPDATLHMADAEFFAKLAPDALFVNTSRGGVHDTQALIDALDSKRLAAAVLDVWEGEPHPEAELLRRALIGTPHIAGHSFDGKVNGTHMLYREVCRLLKVEEQWKPADSLPPPAIPRLEMDGPAFDAQLTATEAALTLYPIARDDGRLREALGMSPDEKARHFASLRVNYPVRRGFHNTEVVLRKGTAEQRRALSGLGFRVV